MKKVVALLPMKGNSERVQNKNLKLFNGKPLYHYVLGQLINSTLITHVVVNTDSDNIKADLKANFPEVIIHDRPAEIIGDLVSMNKIIANDLENIEADYYIQTHSTNPLVKSKTIDNAIEQMINDQQHDSLFSVTQLQTRLYWADCSPVNHNPAELIRTQDLPPIFEENSNFYIFTKDSFKASGERRIGLNPMMFPINKLEAVDIDEPEDFIIAEALYKLDL